MPSINRLLETSLYVNDLDRSLRFYQGLFSLELVLADERVRALKLPGGQMLLLFLRGASNQLTPVPGGHVPPHDGAGRVHLAWEIPADDLEPWIGRLAEMGIELQSIVHAPLGGTSLYFRDPDGHLLELATPGIWPVDP